jgi:phosphoglycerate dehydrogenase-like enzyme
LANHGSRNHFQVLAWIPDEPEREHLGPIPPGVRLTADDRHLGQVEFAVADAWLAGQLVPALPRMTSLRVVQALSAGVDWLPQLPETVTVCDARGVHDIATAEWVMAAVLSALRKIPESIDAQRTGRWVRPPQEELHGSRVLIVGYGSIGAAVEERLAPFGARVDRVARTAREGVHPIEGIAELLPSADIVVLLLPLTSETSGLVDAAFLEHMRGGALLVNAARGPIVDTDALLEALRDGRVRAALDVTDPEPLPEGHPLWSTPGVLVTAHVGGDTPGFRPRAYKLVGDQLRRYAAGEPLINVVEGEY